MMTRIYTILHSREFSFFHLHTRALAAGALILLFACAGRLQAADMEILAIKNNLAYDAALTPNLAVEFTMAPQWSVELGGSLNPFPLDDAKFPKWRHFAVWVAPRYWFCHVFYGGFISLNAAYTHYNVGGNAWTVDWMYPQVATNRYQGDAAMGGLSGGWHFAITSFFSIELEAGVEAGYTWYDQFECIECGFVTAQDERWLVLPKIGVNISFPIGGDPLSMTRRHWRMRREGRIYRYCPCF
ncbi:MAG: DUF3575 domain-containing protein [Paludibacteraceae bacterium]|nr:DUF3575 domain-containing protein [Paludibacteraceae bacterium]